MGVVSEGEGRGSSNRKRPSQGGAGRSEAGEGEGVACQPGRGRDWMLGPRRPSSQPLAPSGLSRRSEDRLCIVFGWGLEPQAGWLQRKPLREV